MTPYDEAYKSLFQNKELLELLFTPEILGAEWSNLLDFNQAQLLPNEQISGSLHLRQNDQVWRVRRKDSADDLYILLLLEFQSHVEPTMALRISTYVTLLYEQLLQRQELRLRDGLPVVLPLVLYTGLANWTARLELSDLIQPAPERLLKYQPQQSYLLLDQGLWAKNKPLPHNNLAALLFLLEHNSDYHEAQVLLRELDQQSASYRELRRAIISWLRYVYLPRVAPTLPIQDNFSFSEVHQMLELDPRHWFYEECKEAMEKGLLEGRQEGREEGLAEGLRRAHVTLLIRQLEAKFGPLSADSQERIRNATNEQREVWALKLLTADTLQAVFI